jgi:hypothetical protein
VAVILWPAGTTTASTRVKGASPFASVVTVFSPRNVLPWLPVGLEKKRMVKLSSGELLRIPSMVILVPVVVAEVRIGLFCSVLGPKLSVSCASLGLGPSGARSIPKPWLEKVELERMRLPLVSPKVMPSVSVTPSPPLKAIVFAPAAVPVPMVLCAAREVQIVLIPSRVDGEGSQSVRRPGEHQEHRRQERQHHP